MADASRRGRNNDGPVAKPGIDPYEIEWPDDSKEQREAERAAAAKRAAVKPAPRALTALVIGLGVAMLFILIVSVAMADLRVFVAVVLPLVAIGSLLAFPIGLLLERVTRTWRTGLPELSFLLVGILIGAGWTYGLVTLTNTYIVEPESVEAAAFFRSVATMFMGTATASAFMAAKFWTDPLRYQPRAVYVLASVIVALTILSVVSWVFGPTV